VLEQFERAGEVAHGEVAVTFRPTIYKKLKLSTHENVGYGTIHLPETTLHTTAAWWVFPRSRAPALGQDELQGALLGVAHALENVAPLYLMSDPRDLGAVAEVKSTHTGDPTVTLFERVPGGVGQAERLYALGGELLSAAHSLVDACGCAEGCPSCVGPVLEVGSRGKQHALDLLGGARVPA